VASAGNIEVIALSNTGLSKYLYLGGNLGLLTQWNTVLQRITGLVVFQPTGGKSQVITSLAVDDANKALFFGSYDESTDYVNGKNYVGRITTVNDSPELFESAQRNKWETYGHSFSVQC